MSDLMALPTINPFDTRVSPELSVQAQVLATMIPSYNFQKAFEAGVAKNFLINTWGGLGDQICAEPAIRYGMKNFKGVTWHLSSRCPSLYSHLKWESVCDTRESEPAWEKYNVFQTIVPSYHLLWEYITHMLSHPVDHAALCMFRMMLPNAAKEIQLPDFDTGNKDVQRVFNYNHSAVVVHAGRHWPSKTFPKEWWNEVLEQLLKHGIMPVLVGATISKELGYVEVDPTGCIDLRDRLSIPEFIELLKGCKMLLSNDSSPIHAAAAGDAYIGMIASCKHPDFLTHWRKGQFGFKTKNLGLDGAWNYDDYSPAQEEGTSCEFLPTAVMEKILPTPESVARFYAGVRDMLY